MVSWSPPNTGLSGSGYSQGILRALSHLRFTFSFGCWWASSALSTWHLLLSIKRKPRGRTVMELWWATALTCSSAQSLLVSQKEAQAIHDIWMALGNLLHTLKPECLVWEQDILTTTHTPSRDAAKLTGSVSFTKGRFHKNWHQRMWFLVPLSKFCPSSYRYWVLSRGKATDAMFDSADPLNEPCRAQPQVVHVQAPVKPQHKHIPQAGGAETRYMLLKTTLGHLTGTQSIMRCHETGRSSWKTEGMKLPSSPATCLSLPLPWAASHRIASLVLQDLWWSPVLLGWLGPYFFSIFCNTEKWICQIS